MGALSPKLRTMRGGFMYWCPGCDAPHTAYVNAPHPSTGALWTWDGNVAAPTVQPSVLCFETENGERRTLCHHFLRGGQLEFLADCAHPLAGQTVALPDWPV